MAIDTPRCMRSHWHECKACEGAGEHTRSHYTGDPQLETWARCDDCGGKGGFRFTRVDCLETLGYYRRGVMRSPGAFNRAYAAQKARCVRRVVLP